MRELRRRLLCGVVLAMIGGVSILGSGCGATGGSEAGNPSRTVVGTLPTSSIAALRASVPGICISDEVVASDSKGIEFRTNVALDCSFELSLPVPEAYRLDVVLSGQLLASMAFDNSPGRFASPVMNLSPGGTGVSLDAIALENGVAVPSREPSGQNDQNGDGQPDFSDHDDDDDGIRDEDELDCDLDGIIGDFDEESPDCQAGEDGPLVLEVSPRSGEGLGLRGSRPSISDEIKIRFSCPIDAATFENSGVRIFPEGDSADLLSCNFTVTGSGKQVRCDHPDLLPDTVYRAQVDGVRCEDGSEVSAVNWSWRTR